MSAVCKRFDNQLTNSSLLAKTVVAAKPCCHQHKKVQFLRIKLK